MIEGRDIPIVQLQPLHKRKVSAREHEKIAAAIQAVGLLEPLIVHQDADDRYTILNGYQRYQVLLDLEKNADVLFQKPLVEYFIKAVGIFPVGSVVELNTGEVGIVTKQSEDQRLRPRVMLVLDENKLPRAETNVINLASSDDSQITTWITRELPKGVHNIDVEAYFLK